MTKSIKQLFTLSLFSLAVVLSAPYIEPAQATRQEVAQKKILQDKLGAIFEATAKDKMQRIALMLKSHGGDQVKQKKQLENCLNFSLKEHKKYFFNLSLAQLQVIFPKVEALKRISKEHRMAIHEVVEEMGILMHNFDKDIQPEAPLDEALQKATLKEVQLEFQEIIRLLQETSRSDQAISAILLPNESEVMEGEVVPMLEKMQQISLACACLPQQALLSKLKHGRCLLEKELEIDKDFMKAIPHSLKKDLQRLAKKVGQKVHTILYDYTELDQASTVSNMILFD